MKKEEKQKKAGKTVTNITREERKEQCCCTSSETAKSGSSEKRQAGLFKIKWQRLISERETCPRCGSTEKEIDKAVAALSKSLAPLGIKIRLEKAELSVSEFKKDPLQSNRILMNGRLLEDWIGGEVGHSACCDVCGPSECRTLEVEGKIYEVIPAELIVKAGLRAASALYSEDSSGCGRDHE